jgi:hypothetical protein
MNLKWKPAQVSIELSRRLLGPDRAKITKRSNYVRPDVDEAIHSCDHPSTEYVGATKIAKSQHHLSKTIKSGDLTAERGGLPENP